MYKLSVIIPCYYNQESIIELMDELNLHESEYLKNNDDKIEYIFIDDGSGDCTFEKLLLIKEKNKEKVKVIKLTGNFGSINAIMAGISEGTGDCYVTLSADLQEPANLIFEMYSVWKKGMKLVIAKRKTRKDPVFTKIYSKIFHSLLRTFAIKEVPKGGFDLVLFDRKIRDYLISIDEKNSNIFYSIFLFKYPYETIEYHRKPRKYGKSKWVFNKKVKLLIDSFVSFSFFPIRIISSLGLLLGFFSFLYGTFVIFARLTGIIPLQGWSALMVVLLFVSSFQMIAIGIIGEYVWRSLDAARNRPNYVVDKIYD